MGHFYRVSPSLWKYLSKRFFLSIFYTTLGFGSFAYMLDVVEHMRRLSGVTNATTSSAFYMSLLKLPDLILELTPFITLLATLLSFYALTKNRELVALRSVGLPARRFILPAFMLMLGIGFFNVAGLGPVSAVLQKQYEKQEAIFFPNITQGIITRQGELWLRQPSVNPKTGQAHDTFLFAKSVTEHGTKLTDVTLFQFDADGNFESRRDASQMNFQYSRTRVKWNQPDTLETYWQLEEVYHFRPQELRVTVPITQPTDPTTPETITIQKPNTHLQWTARDTWKTTLTPATIANTAVSPQTMTLWELYPFIKTLKEAGLPTQQHVLHLHRQLALPAFLLGMFLLAVPFGLRFSRTQGLGRVLLVGVSLGFLFFTFSEIVASYGLAGRLAPAIAAWIPAFVASLVGIGLLVLYREE